MSAKLNLKGLSFGRLTVALEFGTINGRIAWLCDCSCGKTVIVTTHDLRNGDTRSCGCLKHDNKCLQTHGDSSSPEYKAWTAMKDRCYGANGVSYNNYHGRGIVVCERWIYSYENFLVDMGRKPLRSMSLDRIDNDGNYEPRNCRWATAKQQNNNSRNCRFIEYDGKTMTMKQLANEYNIGYYLLRDRISVLGWSVDRAIKTPKRTINK